MSLYSNLNDFATSVKTALARKADTTALSGKEDNTNKVTSLSAQSTDTQYPSAKCVYDLIGGLDELLGTGVIE